MQKEPTWQRQLLVGLSVLLVVGVLLGALVAGVAVKAADYVGLGDGSGKSSPAPILPTTGSATDTAPPPTHHTPTHHPSRHTTHPAQQAIRLTASPTHVGSYQQINLVGRYPGKDGVTLQVQRSLGTGSWADFPATITVRAGQFATYVKTGMAGRNHFRMLDKATGRTSNSVTVTIG